MLDVAEFLSAGLFFSTICFAGAVLIVSAGALADAPRGGAIALAIVMALAVATALLLEDLAAAAALAIGGAVIFAAVVAMRDFTPAGRVLLASHLQLSAWFVVFGALYLATIDVSVTTRTLLFVAYPFVAITLPVSLVSTYGTWEVLCRRRWRRPRTALPAADPDRSPKVSIHVPISSEPPAVVGDTLDALARLDYPDYEVLVIDNNTRDPALWRPVEERCAELGPRFRFFHVEELAGAKAGALNYALRETAADAALIAVVDGDYEARPDFLSRLAGFFGDPNIGFVQTPHEYRDWERSTFLRWCRWEYKLFFHTTMVTMNERDAALIVGTMCIIRRAAVEAAGGWAEWCLTEDSELSIRIHAAGYSSVYVDEAFGRGLIPPTFAGYKSQRYRWTYGPIQELRAHLRLFLPRPFGRPSRLTRAHRLHHLHHGLDRFKIGLGMALMPIDVAAIVSLLAHGEGVSVPVAIWVSATAVLVSGFMLKWQVYRSKGCPPGDALGALIAAKALSHTITLASIHAILRRPASWRRTDKFRAAPRPFAGIGAAGHEMWLGAVSLVFSLGGLIFALRSPLLALLLLGAVYQSVNFLCAPAMAILADRHLQAMSRLDAQDTPAAPEHPEGALVHR